MAVQTGATGSDDRGAQATEATVGTPFEAGEACSSGSSPTAGRPEPAQALSCLPSVLCFRRTRTAPDHVSDSVFRQTGHIPRGLLDT